MLTVNDAGWWLERFYELVECPHAEAGTAALTEDPAAEFLHWLIRLDDPADARGVEDRRTVTLNQIIERARRVLAGDGRE